MYVSFAAPSTIARSRSRRSTTVPSDAWTMGCLGSERTHSGSTSSVDSLKISGVVRRAVAPNGESA